MENKNKISKQEKHDEFKRNPTQIKSATLPKRNVIVVSTALTAEGRDTPVFGGGEIFHTIFISSSRTRNIWYGKMFTHLFVENAYIYSFHQFCIPCYLFVGLNRTNLAEFQYGRVDSPCKASGTNTHTSAVPKKSLLP